jgi:hypothetical protein
MKRIKPINYGTRANEVRVQACRKCDELWEQFYKLPSYSSKEAFDLIHKINTIEYITK